MYAFNLKGQPMLIFFIPSTEYVRNIFQSHLVIEEISREYPTSDMCASEYLRKTHYDL